MKTSDRIILKGYFWNHDAIRKDVHRMQKVLDRSSGYLAKDWAAVLTWFRYHKTSLLHHHEAEDHVFFPMISQRFPEFGDQLKRLDDQHHALDDALDKAEAGLEKLSSGTGGDPGQVVRDLQAYMQLAISHLDEEEPVVEDAAGRIPMEEFLSFERKFLAEMPMDVKVHTMPWMMDAMDDKDRSFLMGTLPFMAKVMFRFKLNPSYQKMVNRL